MLDWFIREQHTAPHTEDWALTGKLSYDNGEQRGDVNARNFDLLNMYMNLIARKRMSRTLRRENGMAIDTC